MFPGQGAFGATTGAIVDGALGAALRMVIDRGDPFLGICLGMQLLFDHSDENGGHDGLGVFRGQVRRFPSDMPAGEQPGSRNLKIPHVGWNDVHVALAHWVAHAIVVGGLVACAAVLSFGYLLNAVADRAASIGIPVHRLEASTGAAGLFGLIDFCKSVAGELGDRAPAPLLRAIDEWTTGAGRGGDAVYRLMDRLRPAVVRLYDPFDTACPITVDVRIVAATNRDLAEEVSKGRFREDLFYRLNVVSLHMPSLRERKTDIPTLAKFFLDRFAKENSKGVTELAPEALALLISHDWPGAS